MSPEARPASCSATPARAALETGMNANEVPTPTLTNGPARQRKHRPCPGMWAAHSPPPPIMVMPAAITRRARPRVTSACDKTGEGDRGERGRQPGQAGLQRGVTEYLLHVEGADKDEREEAAAEQHAN